MLMEVKSHIKLIFMSFKYNLLKGMDNRVAFIGQVLGMLLNNALMIIQWIVLFSIKDNIGVYVFKDVLLLWGLAASTYGVAHTFFESVFTLSNLIIEGKLDAFLVQPKNTLLYVATSKMKVSAVGDILYGFIILIILHLPLITSLLFILFSITGGLIVAAVAIIFNSLTFYFGSSEEIATTINNTIVNVGTYPDGIFDGKVRLLLLTIIPVSWIMYIPIDVMLSFNIGLTLSVIVFTIFIITLAYIIFKNGLKRYSSSNLMSARI